RAHAVQGAGRGSDLGREVRKGGQVVAEDGGGAREPVAGELHPVARIAGEPDDDPLFLLDGLGHGSLRCLIGARVGSSSMVQPPGGPAWVSRPRPVWRYGPVLT